MKERQERDTVRGERENSCLGLDSVLLISLESCNATMQGTGNLSLV